MGIDDDYLAYCLDQAVAYWGQFVEHELELVGDRPSKKERSAMEARKRRLRQLIQTDGPEPEKGTFADPAAFFK